MAEQIRKGYSKFWPWVSCTCGWASKQNWSRHYANVMARQHVHQESKWLSTKKA